MTFEPRRGTTLPELHQQLYGILPHIIPASKWDGKDGKFKAITPDGIVYIVTVQHEDGLQHRYKEKLGHISTLI